MFNRQQEDAPSVLDPPHALYGYAQAQSSLLQLPGMLQEPEDGFHGTLEEEFNDSWLVARSWDDAFLGALGPVPEVLHSPCCSEFVVSQERIQARPKAFYIHVRWAAMSAQPLSGRQPMVTAYQHSELTICWCAEIG